MKDGIIKEDGTSRLVKGSLPATYDEFKALAASAGVPVDVLFNAAGWQQLPTFLNKANLLQDFTATLLGLDPADDPTVDDAFLNVFLTSANAGLLKIRIYETGTTTPISGVHIIGATDLLGGDLYADANGLAVGMATSETSTLQVDTSYIDLTGQTVFSGATPAQQITEITLYATRVSNPDGKIETFTTSTQKMFTDKVNRVDVHCVGGGAGGQSGSAKLRSVDDGIVPSASGGYGGGAGKDSYQLSVGFTPNRLFSIVIGAHGTGGVADASGTSEQSAHDGTTGGATSCLEVVASGGSINKTAGARANRYYPNDRNASEAASSANYIFGEESLGLVAGGDGGGGGGRYNSNSNSDSSTGGSPNGGNGGGPTSPGRNAKGPGGGGGGGGARTDDTAGTYFYGYNGGNGGDGTVYVRWFYT